MFLLSLEPKIRTMNNDITFRNWKKTITLFMTGQAISLFGSALVEFAVIWHITLATKSGVAMAIGTACVFLPRLIVSLFAGVWADRNNRKALIIWSDTGIAAVTLLLAIIYLAGYRELWLIFLVLGIRSVGTGIQTPAVGAIIPQMVPEDRLLKINGINGSLQSAIMLLAPVVSAGLLSIASLGMIFFIDVITAAIGICILMLLPIKSHIKPDQEPETDYISDLKEGWEYVTRNIFVREMLVMYTFYFFLITPAAFLSQIAVARNFGEEVWRLSALEVAFSGGMMLGGGIIAWWGGLKNRINTIALSCLVVGISCSLLYIPDFYIYMAMMLIMGVFASFFNATEMTLFQEIVEVEKQGRVFSWVQIVATAIMPAGMLLFGPLGDIINLNLLFLICGILLILQSVQIFFNKTLKNAAMKKINCE